MEVADDQSRGPEDPVRWPAVPMEYSDLVPDNAGGRMDGHFSGQVASETDVVIPEHDLHSQPTSEQGGEEIEDH